jgi:predicted negative regulator of RcsB-dependent stress response
MTPESTGSHNQSDRVALWLDANKKNLIGIVVIAFVAVVASSYMSHAKKQQLEAANEAMFSAAPPRFMAGMEEQEPDVEALQKVAKDFSGMPTAQQVALLAADALYSKGDFAGALKAFQQITKDYPNGLDKFTAEYGVASSQDALGETDEAIQSYQRIVDSYKNDRRVHLASLSLGRLLESAGRSADALAAYDAVVDSDLLNGWKTEASLRREALIKAHPELEPEVAAVDEATAGSEGEASVETTEASAGSEQ